MTKLNEIYKCEVCGNIIELVHTGVGELVCCGKPMVVQEANTIDADEEKHVPVVEVTDKGIKVTVGSVAHPMDADHYIEWIEVVADGQVLRQNLKPGSDAMAGFCCIATDKVTARAYCNLHGLWKS
jgi:superoxide reductase